MPLIEHFRGDLVTIEPNASLTDAAKLMKQRHVGDLIVVNRLNGAVRPTGIITDRDITLAAGSDLDLGNVRVDAIMSRNLTTASADQDVLEVTDKMTTNGIRRLPIVDESGKIVGIVTCDDLYQIFAKKLDSLSSICHKQIGIESAQRAISVRRPESDNNIEGQSQSI